MPSMFSQASTIGHCSLSVFNVFISKYEVKDMMPSTFFS